MGSLGEELLGHVGENKEEEAQIPCSLQCEFNFVAGIDCELKVSVFSQHYKLHAHLIYTPLELQRSLLMIEGASGKVIV